MNVLWVVRHAAAEHSPGVPDFDRSLRPKGHREAKLMQRWLATQPNPASLVVSSAARRAVETARYVLRGFDLSDDALATDHELYGASAGTLLQALRQLPTSTDNVALVGHNPGVSDLVGFLLGSSSVDLPTCGIAALTCPVPWSSLLPGAAELSLLGSPRTPSRNDNRLNRANDGSKAPMGREPLLLCRRALAPEHNVTVRKSAEPLDHLLMGARVAQERIDVLAPFRRRFRRQPGK